MDKFRNKFFKLNLDNNFYIIILLIFYNFILLFLSNDLGDGFRNIAQTGLEKDRVKGFLDLIIDQGIYPAKILENQLVMEDGWALRFGRKLHGYLYYLSYLISLGQIKYSLLPINYLLHTITVITLFITLKNNFNIIFAILSVLIFQSHPWIFNEFFVKSNIQGYYVIGTILSSCILLNFTNYTIKEKFFSILILSFLISILISINEMSLIVAAYSLFVILFLNFSFRNKLLYSSFFVLLVLLFNLGFNQFFDYKKKNSENYVKLHQGKVFDLDYNVNHIKWTSFYMALSEFEKEKGFGFWDDTLTYPEIYEKIGINNNKLEFEKSENGYLIHPHSYNHTENLFKKKVIQKFYEDPILFLKTFAQRTSYLLQNLSPIKLTPIFEIYFFKNIELNKLFVLSFIIFFLIKFSYQNNKKIYFLILSSLITFVPGIIYQSTQGVSYSIYTHYFIFSFLMSIPLMKLKKYFVDKKI